VTIKGSLTASNTLTGGAGKDVIVGGAKADVITGGAKGDTLTSGGGNDKFVYAAGDSSIGTGAFDTITDFKANTYGNGTDGAAGTGVGTADATKVNGSILSFLDARPAATLRVV
jgi:Ca2+-binding RTX toxin-like protein